ncbi:hypothetical protein ACHHYP_15392 [Achlya hypogyna]|uniref:Uncharacterized protein n=1 Tax=Achlya hypogyna TaxID=1202772 RepID=A0A1V9YB30_ACHHY|nr:hypothetical protein ACHHYP_15392 [Achlya hypogyna]
MHLVDHVGCANDLPDTLPDPDTMPHLLAMDEGEIETLEAMGGFLATLHETNALLVTLNTQVVALSHEFAKAERNLSALSIPFRSTMYEVAMREEKQPRASYATNSPKLA